MSQRVEKVKEPELWKEDFGAMFPWVYGYRFTDELTGNKFETSASAPWSTVGGEPLGLINDMHRLVMNRAQSSTRINTYLATASHPWWPMLVAGGGSGRIMAQRVAIEKTLCFSNNVDCTGDSARMPQGHNYRDFNITEIIVQSGAFIDYIHIAYTSSVSGQRLVQEFGNPNSGNQYSVLRTDDGVNPIVKAVWSADKPTLEPSVVTSLMGLKLALAGGQEFNLGVSNGGRRQDFIDDFSIWKGKVWL